MSHTHAFIGNLHTFLGKKAVDESEVRKAVSQASSRLNQAGPLGVMAVIGYDLMLFQVRIYVTDGTPMDVRDADGKAQIPGYEKLSADPEGDALALLQDWEARKDKNDS